MASSSSSESAKGGVTDKPNSKATKTAKKPQQCKKSSGKAAAPKEIQAGRNLNFLGNMTAISKPLAPSDLTTKTLCTGVSIAPSLWTNSDSYLGQNPVVPKGSTQQMTSIQPLTMTFQHIPKIDSVFSYQPSTLSGVSQSGGYAKICIESVKDLSLGPSGKVVSSVVTSPSLSSKATQNVHTRLLQNTPAYPVVQKAIPPSGNISSQEKHSRQSFQSLTTPCTSTPATTGGNLAAGIGMVSQSQMTFPLVNYSQTMSVPNGQITTSGMYTQVPQTSQVKSFETILANTKRIIQSALYKLLGIGCLTTPHKNLHF